MTITLSWGAFQMVYPGQGIQVIYVLSTGKVSKVAVILDESRRGNVFLISPLSVNENGFLDQYPGATKVDDIS